MGPEDTDRLEAELAGLALHLLLAGLPLESMDRHFPEGGAPRVPAGSSGYPHLLREAIGDLRDAAVACGYSEEVVRTWGAVPVPVVLAVGERLLDEMGLL